MEYSYSSDRCPTYASFFGAFGCVTAIVFCNFGASYGMSKSGIGLMASGVLRPELMVRNLLPAILASVLSIYGLVIALLISQSLKEELPLYTAFLQLGAGLSVGLSGLAAGFSIGIVGDAGVRATVMQPRMFLGMVMILIFSEAMALYGVIVSLLLITRSSVSVEMCRR